MTNIIFKGSQVLIDLLALTIAFLMAFYLRFGEDLSPHYFKLFFFTLPYVVLLQYLVLSLFGVPNFAWRYVNLRDAQWIALSLFTSAAVLVCVRLLSSPFGGYSSYLSIPFSIILGDFILAIAGVVGVRAIRRTFGERRDIRKQGIKNSRLQPTLLIGAGQAGVIVAREIAARPDLQIKPIGFIDDDLMKQGTRVHGLKVLGTVNDLEALAKEHKAEAALITIANTKETPIRRIAQKCREAKLNTKIIPCIYELVSENISLSRIRDVAIEDLLGRAPVELDESALRNTFEKAPLLISGAGGSIGSELCRQALKFQPSSIILVEKSENALFEIHRELKRKFPDIEIVPVLADIRDRDRLKPVFSKHRPTSVIHAAAHKHVPMVEWNSGEAVYNNVVGTKVLADLANQFNVNQFVLISTDKAVNPTSVMGATKRVAELYVQSLSKLSKTRFVVVRFGNVLGSAGSVIPIFSEQIARGGPVTVTDPEMTRYFMTIPEASQLVLQAASMGQGGEIFILDMGSPIKILQLAKDLIELSGLRPGDDIDIVFSGIRPGEKLFEELSIDNEFASKTKHPKIFIGRIASQKWQTVESQIENLKKIALAGTHSEIKYALKSIVPEFKLKIPVSNLDLLPKPGKEEVNPVVPSLVPNAPSSSDSSSKFPRIP